MSEQKNPAVDSIDVSALEYLEYAVKQGGALDLSSVVRNAEYLEPGELVESDDAELVLSAVKQGEKGLGELVESDDAELVLSAVKQGEKGLERMSPLSQEEILERRNIGRNCIPGTNKIDTARRNASPAEGREAAVKICELEK